MNRYISDPTGLTFNDLQNTDWDLIKLKITVNTSSAMDWVAEVEKNNQDSIWTFERDDLVDETHRERFLNTQKKLLVKSEIAIPEQWGLQWSFQRDGVIPFMMYADKKQFPEIHEDGFLERWNQNLKKYEFGFWKKYYETLGPEVFQVTRLVKFPKNCGLNTHKDTDKGHLIRMHTVPQIGADHYFDYTDDMNNPVIDPARQYKLEAGCTYLLNTGIPHKAINYDNTDWWMLHNNPTPVAIDQLCNTELHIS
jgi:hypothetical protein